MFYILTLSIKIDFDPLASETPFKIIKLKSDSEYEIFLILIIKGELSMLTALAFSFEK